tara:strand:- start:1237 stop:1728 length:492 start_codon:yes stop_codon:yes gene_type:complete
MTNNLKPIEIANKIKELSGVDLFANSRKRNLVEMRALLIYILRDKLKMRWVAITLFFKTQNKPVHHATLIHSRKNFHLYKKHNKQFQKILNIFSFKSNLSVDEIDRIHYLENKCKSLQKKLENPLVKLVRAIPEEEEEEAVKNIDIAIKTWKWKEKALANGGR